MSVAHITHPSQAASTPDKIKNVALDDEDDYLDEDDDDAHAGSDSDSDSNVSMDLDPDKIVSVKNQIIAEDIRVQLETARSRNEPLNILVFTSRMAEIQELEKMLQRDKRINCVTYHGKMTSSNKSSSINAFTIPHIPINVLIMNMKCGNLGLNLQCASRVYITSPQ